MTDEHRTAVQQPSDSNSPKLGFVACWGEYPLVLARAFRAHGYRIYCLGVAGHFDPQLPALCEEFQTVGLGKLGGAIRFFKRHGIQRASMAGKFHKVVLYQPWVWLRHLPDWRAIKTFYPHFVLSRQDRRDDTLLGALVDEFAKEDIRFLPPTDLAPELLVKHGNITARRPTRGQLKEVEFGWTLAKEMGRLDVGQTVVVKGRAPIAIEAIEGTDLCIRRAGELCGGGFTVVKVAKPQQDMRFDVPTIGVGTLESMVAAGGSVLAVEAGKTIIVNQDQVAQFADRNGITIIAVTADEQGLTLEDIQQQAA